MAQQMGHLLSSYTFRIEEVVDTHIDKHLLVVGLQIFVIVDTSDRFLRAQLLCHNGGKDILILVVINGNKEVATTHTSTAQHSKSRSIALDGDKVG